MEFSMANRLAFGLVFVMSVCLFFEKETVNRTLATILLALMLILILALCALA